MDTSEGIDERSGCLERTRVSIESVQSLPDRYFVYENEQYSRVLTCVDEDTIAYGSHDPNKRNAYFIVASKSRKRLVSVLYVDEDGNVVPVEVDQEKVEIIDIGGLGERWEGPTLEDSPFGWGKRFDEDGELVYEGFSVFGNYSLYGTEYYPDSHNLSYQGTWCDGLRCGRGRQYDRNGSVVYEGEWVNDFPMVDVILCVPDSTNLLPPIASLVVSLRIGKKWCGSNSSLVLQSFPRLRELVIGGESFGKESEEKLLFSCVKCPELVSISLEEKAMQFFSKVIITGKSENKKRGIDNPKLRKLNVGNHCVTHFCELRIESESHSEC